MPATRTGRYPKGTSSEEKMARRSAAIKEIGAISKAVESRGTKKEVSGGVVQPNIKIEASPQSIPASGRSNKHNPVSERGKYLDEEISKGSGSKKK